MGLSALHILALARAEGLVSIHTRAGCQGPGWFVFRDAVCLVSGHTPGRWYGAGPLFDKHPENWDTVERLIKMNLL